MNDEIEDEQNQLEKETIDVKERYNDCVDLLRDFDEGHKLLHNDVEQLIGVYADAAELVRISCVCKERFLHLFYTFNYLET